MNLIDSIIKNTISNAQSINRNLAKTIGNSELLGDKNILDKWDDMGQQEHMDLLNSLGSDRYIDLAIKRETQKERSQQAFERHYGIER